MRVHSEVFCNTFAIYLFNLGGVCTLYQLHIAIAFSSHTKAADKFNARGMKWEKNQRNPCCLHVCINRSAVFRIAPRKWCLCVFHRIAMWTCAWMHAACNILEFEIPAIHAFNDDKFYQFAFPLIKYSSQITFCFRERFPFFVVPDAQSVPCRTTSVWPEKWL